MFIEYFENNKKTVLFPIWDLEYWSDGKAT